MSNCMFRKSAKKDELRKPTICLWWRLIFSLNELLRTLPVFFSQPFFPKFGQVNLIPKKVKKNQFHSVCAALGETYEEMQHFFRLTLIFLMTPPVGLNELNRTRRSSAFIRSQSMLQTANREVISVAAGASLSNSAHLWSNFPGICFPTSTWWTQRFFFHWRHKKEEKRKGKKFCPINRCLYLLRTQILHLRRPMNSVCCPRHAPNQFLHHLDNMKGRKTLSGVVSIFEHCVGNSNECKDMGGKI